MIKNIRNANTKATYFYIPQKREKSSSIFTFTPSLPDSGASQKWEAYRFVRIGNFFFVISSPVSSPFIISQILNDSEAYFVVVS